LYPKHGWSISFALLKPVSKPSPVHTGVVNKKIDHVEMRVCTLNECFRLWVLKISFSAQAGSNQVIENVHAARENRL
jgi:hypothetical protein